VTCKCREISKGLIAAQPDCQKHGVFKKDIPDPAARKETPADFVKVWADLQKGYKLTFGTVAGTNFSLKRMNKPGKIPRSEYYQVGYDGRTTLTVLRQQELKLLINGCWVVEREESGK
jgi:hypothetical protein